MQYYFHIISRKELGEQIMKIQEENRKTYNLRKEQYQVGDLVVIKRTQQGPVLKMKSKFLEPYKITKKNVDTYKVQQMEGSCEARYRQQPIESI